MKPAAHGTKHCQRYRPLPGVRNVNEIVSWSVLSGQGALSHGFLAPSGMPVQRHRDAELRDREDVRGGDGIDRLGRLAVEREVAADGALRLAMNGLRSPDWPSNW